MTNRIAVITGATSGIGRVGAVAVAKAGYRLVLPCRNSDKGEAVKAEIARAAPDTAVEIVHCDMSSLASVRRCGQRIADMHDDIGLLINNAGLVSLSLAFSEDGIERTFAVNHLGHFVLTHHLLPTLEAGDGARIVHTASEAVYQGDATFLDDPNYERHRYRFFKAYANSKLANVLFSNRLARDLKNRGVTSNAFHPGRVATGIWPEDKWYQRMIITPLKRFYLISPEQGAKPMIKLATEAEMANVTGHFYYEMVDRDPGKQALDPALQDKLWSVSESLAAEFL